MALYFLSHDLRRDRDYQRLYDELASFNAVHILESQWCFNRLNTNAAVLRDYFRRFINNDEGLLVTEVTKWSTVNTLGTPDDL